MLLEHCWRSPQSIIMSLIPTRKMSLLKKHTPVQMKRLTDHMAESKAGLKTYLLLCKYELPPSIYTFNKWTIAALLFFNLPPKDPKDIHTSYKQNYMFTTFTCNNLNFRDMRIPAGIDIHSIKLRVNWIINKTSK